MSLSWGLDWIAFIRNPPNEKRRVKKRKNTTGISAKFLVRRVGGTGDADRDGAREKNVMEADGREERTERWTGIHAESYRRRGCRAAQTNSELKVCKKNKQTNKTLFTIKTGLHSHPFFTVRLSLLPEKTMCGEK